MSTNNILQVIALWDIPADTDHADIIGEIIGDADTDDPLVALKTAFPQSCRGFWLSPPEGESVRLSELRRRHRASEGILNGN